MHTQQVPKGTNCLHQQQVTRIAPSPTGQMHIGTARTALFNYLAAKCSGGKFIVRIDDTDEARNDDAYTDGIFKSLEFLGLTPDEVHHQSARKYMYVNMAHRLLDTRHAKELDNGAIALQWSDDMPRSWHDEIAGEVKVSDQDIEHIHERLILTKGGDNLGHPTYQLASTFDDHDMGINHVIRGTDHIPNTAKQVALAWAMAQADGIEYTPPKYSHIGLVYKNKKKMSKRDGAESILTYSEQGYSVDALWNALIRLGWAPSMKAPVPMKDDKSADIIGCARALEVFLDSGAMKNSQANFDEAKLNYYNKKHKALAARAA